jgi:hypothetical protein
LSILVDWLLVIIIVCILVWGASFIIPFATFWGWCLDTFDVRTVRYWSREKWLCFVGAWLGILLLMRLWPEAGKRAGGGESLTAVDTTIQTREIGE